MVEKGQQRTVIVLLADTVKAHGIKALEDVAVLPMTGSAAMRINESLDLLEARDDALLARRAACRLLRLDDDAELGEQGLVLVGEFLIHRPPRPSCGRGRPPLPPCASPRDPLT